MTRALALLAVLFSASIASAQGVGFVGGGTIDPEQFYAGTFFETRPISGTIHIRPGIDGSWGQGVSIAAINLDIITRAQIGSGWQFYTGGGPTVSILRFSGNAVPDDASDKEVTGGVTAGVGVFPSQRGPPPGRLGRAAGGPA